MQKLRNIFIILLVLLVSTLSLILNYSITSNAQSLEVINNLNSTLTSTPDAPSLTEKEIADFDKYITANKLGLLVLDSQTVLKSGISTQETINKINKYLKNYNYKLNQIKKTQLQLVQEDKSFTFSNPEMIIKNDFSSAQKAIKKSKKCQKEARLTYKWWGDQLFLNHCLIKDLALKNLAGRVAAGVICSVLTFGICTPIFAGLSSVISIYLVTLRFNSAKCKNKGAYLNRNKVNLFWVTKVC